MRSFLGWWFVFVPNGDLNHKYCTNASKNNLPIWRVPKPCYDTFRCVFADNDALHMIFSGVSQYAHNVI